MLLSDSRTQQGHSMSWTSFNKFIRHQIWRKLPMVQLARWLQTANFIILRGLYHALTSQPITAQAAITGAPTMGANYLLQAQVLDFNKVSWEILTTLILRPPIITPFICSNASWAASGMSYSMKAKPLCLFVTGSHDRFTLLIGPNGMKACLMVSSLISKLMLPT